MVDEKRKKIVICGANGGIGQEIVKEYARRINATGEALDICFVTRPKDEVKDFGTGMLNEIMDAHATDPVQHSNADLEKAFRRENHALFDPKHIDTPEIRKVFKDADLILVAAGLPRKGNQERADLISKNADAVSAYSQAIARYAPLKTPVVACANPLDNVIGIMQKAVEREWKDNPRKGEKPQIKIIGMAGALDEDRLKIFVSRTLNAALKKLQPPTSERVRPRQVDGRVYGQHGPQMAVDSESITIMQNGQPVTLNDFIDKYEGLKADRAAIIKEITENTQKAGGKLLGALGRSAQYSPARRMVDMGEALLGITPARVFAASVTHSLDGEMFEPMSSGRPVNLSASGATVAPWPHRITKEPLASTLKASRDAIWADQAGYEILLVLAQTTDMAYSEEHDGRFKVSLEMPLKLSGQMKQMAATLNTWLPKDPATHSEVHVKRGQPPKIVGTLNKAQFNLMRAAVPMGREMVLSSIAI